MADELRVDSGALIFATLADVYISSGMIDEAISILKDGLVRNPDYHLAKVILGRAYCLKGDCSKAIETVEPIYQEIKDDENANLCLGQCYLKLGNTEKARGFYEAALKLNTENEETLRVLGQLVPEFTPAPEAPVTEVDTSPEPQPEHRPGIREEATTLPPEEVVIDELVLADETPESFLRELPEKTPRTRKRASRSA